MQIPIDAAGRIVIPKALREEAHLRAGSKLEISLRGEAIILEPAPLEVELQESQGVFIASPKANPGVLRATLVDRTLDAVRTLDTRPDLLGLVS